MSFSDIRKLIGRVNPFYVRDVIMHSGALSDLERATLIGMLVSSQHPNHNSSAPHRAEQTYAY